MDQVHDCIGVVYAPDEGYPYRLKRRLDAMYPAAAVSILNAGVSGARAVDGAQRLERDVLSRKPDLVVIAFALNDSMNADVEGGLAQYRAAIFSIILMQIRTLLSNTRPLHRRFNGIDSALFCTQVYYETAICTRFF